MLKMRLQRRGKKNYATYRVVVAQASAPVKGRFIEDLGHYDAHTDEFSVSKEKVTEWLGKGVQPSPTVHNLLVTHKLIKAEKVQAWKPRKKEGEEAPAETSAEAKPAEEAKKSE